MSKPTADRHHMSDDDSEEFFDAEYAEEDEVFFEAETGEEEEEGSGKRKRTIPAELAWLVAGIVFVNVVLGIALLVRRDATGVAGAADIEECKDVLADAGIFTQAEWEEWEAGPEKEGEVAECGRLISNTGSWNQPDAHAPTSQSAHDEVRHQGELDNARRTMLEPKERPTNYKSNLIKYGEQGLADDVMEGTRNPNPGRALQDKYGREKAAAEETQKATEETQSDVRNRTQAAYEEAMYAPVKKDVRNRTQAAYEEAMYADAKKKEKAAAEETQKATEETQSDVRNRTQAAYEEAMYAPVKKDVRNRTQAAYEEAMYADAKKKADEQIAGTTENKTGTYESKLDEYGRTAFKDEAKMDEEERERERREADLEQGLADEVVREAAAKEKAATEEQDDPEPELRLGNGVEIKKGALKRLKKPKKDGGMGLTDLAKYGTVVGFSGDDVQLVVGVTYGRAYVGEGVRESDLTRTKSCFKNIKGTGAKDCKKRAEKMKSDAEEQMKNETLFNTWYGAVLRGEPVFDYTTGGALVAVVLVIGGAAYALSRSPGAGEEEEGEEGYEEAGMGEGAAPPEAAPEAGAAD